MFYIWWPAYIVPGLMVLAGFAGQLLPGRKYRSPQGPLAPERQKFADSLFLKLLRQSGPVFAALSFMIMRSVRLMAITGQQILLYIAVILQIIRRRVRQAEPDPGRRGPPPGRVPRGHLRHAERRSI